MTLQEKFDQLENLLLNHRETIGIHNGVPFIMLIYSPEEELQCQKYIKNLHEKLESKNNKVLKIPLNTLIFERLKDLGNLEEIFEYDKEVPAEVRKELFKQCQSFFKDYILDQIQKEDPNIVLVTNVSGLYPYYRVSNLLTALEKNVYVPFVVFYPGEIKDDIMYFMGDLESNEYYRAQRI